MGSWNLLFMALRLPNFAMLVALLLVAVGTNRVEAQLSQNCFIQGAEGDFGTFDSKVCSCDEGCQCNVAALTCETACTACITPPTDTPGSNTPGCTTVDDCTYDPKYGSATVCYKGRCRTCQIIEFTESLPWKGSCYRVCDEPGPASDEHCRADENGEYPFCFAAKAFGYEELIFLNSQNKPFPFGGLCMRCENGSYPNADYTDCVNSGPPVEAPTLGLAEPPPATPPANHTSPVNPPGGTAAPPASSPAKSPPFLEAPRPATIRSMPAPPGSFAPSGAPTGSVPDAALEQHLVQLWLVVLSIGWTLSWNIFKLL